jgi:UDP-glucose 4-epimerase
MLKNCRVLITGGAGFIGSHIATRLANDNEVLIYDNFSSGRQENIEHLMDNANVKVLREDIRDKTTLEKHMNEVDYVFHLAAVASVPESIAEPIKTNEVNITGTLNILKTAHELGVKKVVFSSSAAVYGDEPTLPKIETMPTMPMSPYAVTKISGEDYLRVFYENFKLPTVSLRYFNVFGPRQDPKSSYATVVPKFIEFVMNNKPPVIFGDGGQTRDFIYVDDVVDANITAALNDNANGKIFNIAGGSGITINELAEMIIQLSGNDLSTLHEPERLGDIKYSYADITKARTELGWEPKKAIADGLKTTFDYFKN